MADEGCTSRAMAMIIPDFSFLDLLVD